MTLPEPHEIGRVARLGHFDRDFRCRWCGERLHVSPSGKLVYCVHCDVHFGPVPA